MSYCIKEQHARCKKIVDSLRARDHYWHTGNVLALEGTDTMNRKNTTRTVINYVAGTALIGCAAVLSLGNAHAISAAEAIGILWMFGQVCAD